MFEMNQLDWFSSDNHSFLNPRIPPGQTELLNQLLAPVQAGLKGHIFLLSSGTTLSSGLDLKWVALSKSAFLKSAEAVNRHLQASASDVWLQPLPEFHVGGLSILARSILCGARVVSLLRWECGEFLALAKENRVTLTALVPAQLYDLVQGGYPCPSSLRALLVGGGAISPALYQRARELGWPVLPTYGMTETCSQIATASLDSLQASVDLVPEMAVLPHLEVETILDGRLRIRGQSLLTGYVSQPAQGVHPHLEDPKREGWLVSQDKGEKIDNILRILGRVGDFVKIGGESVEVDRLRKILEEIRLGVGDTGNMALFPVPDERLGHVIHLFSEERASFQDASELAAVAAVIEKFNSKVLAFEKIRKHHRVQAIPRTALGKLIPSALLEMIK